MAGSGSQVGTKRRMYERRFDARGGLDTRTSPEVLQPNKFVQLDNCRISSDAGAIEVRQGSRRLSAASLGGSVTQLETWLPDTSGSAPQIVAVANGDLFYKITDYGAWSSESPTPAIASVKARMFTARSAAASAALYLYVVDGTNVWRFDGVTTITQVNGTDQPPDSSYLGAEYHVRSFWVSSLKYQHLVWSKIGYPEDTTVGARDGGGEAQVQVGSGAPITALEKIGSSLLIGTRDALGIYSGYSSMDIQIEQDTQGLSSDQGPLGPYCMKRFGKGAAAVICDEGLYVASEKEFIGISGPIQPTFMALARTYMSGAVVCAHQGRSEIWFAVPGASDSGYNKTVLVFSTELGAWVGRFTFPFAIVSMASYRRNDGTETIIAGCSDGYVRDLDDDTVAGYDDVLYDGSGGSSFAFTVEWAPIYFDVGPGATKTLERLHLHAKIASGSSVALKWAFDDASLSTKTISGDGWSVHPYLEGAYGQGDRLRVQVYGAAASNTVIRGLVATAFDMQREAET